MERQTSDPGRLTPSVNTEYEAGWVAEPILTFWNKHISLAPVGIPSPAHPTHSLVSYAMPVPVKLVKIGAAKETYTRAVQRCISRCFAGLKIPSNQYSL